MFQKLFRFLRSFLSNFSAQFWSEKWLLSFKLKLSVLWKKLHFFSICIHDGRERCASSWMKWQLLRTCILAIFYYHPLTFHTITAWLLLLLGLNQLKFENGGINFRNTCVNDIHNNFICIAALNVCNTEMFLVFWCFWVKAAPSKNP